MRVRKRRGGIKANERRKERCRREERNLGKGKKKNEKEIKGILEEDGKRKWRKEEEDGKESGRGIKGAFGKEEE